MTKTKLRTVKDRHGLRITEVIAPKNWREELAESTRRRKELNRQAQIIKNKDNTT